MPHESKNLRKITVILDSIDIQLILFDAIDEQRKFKCTFNGQIAEFALIAFYWF